MLWGDCLRNSFFFSALKNYNKDWQQSWSLTVSYYRAYFSIYWKCCTYAAKSLTGFISQAQKLSQQTLSFLVVEEMSERLPHLSVILFPFICCCLNKVMDRQEVCIFPSISFLNIAMDEELLFNNKDLFIYWEQ